jgi:hypothetical protein
VLLKAPKTILRSEGKAVNKKTKVKEMALVLKIFIESFDDRKTGM